MYQYKKVNKVFIFLSGLITLTAIIILFTWVWVEPRIENKIRVFLKEYSNQYSIVPEVVQVSVLTLSLELKNIDVFVNNDTAIKKGINLKIASIKIKGINPIHALLNKDIIINKVIVSGLHGFLFLQDSGLQNMILSFNIKIHKFIFNNVNVLINKHLNPQLYSVKQAYLTLYDLEIHKNGSIPNYSMNNMEFKSKSFDVLTKDSIYNISINDFKYSEKTKILEIDSIIIHPNYDEYEFNLLYAFQKDYIKGRFSKINIYDFSVMDYINHSSIKSSFIEIGNMDMDLFRDNRKPSSHKIKKELQELIYTYPDTLNIDSIELKNGNVSYSEHVENAILPGKISFKDIHAMLYKISNDSFYIKNEAYLEIKSTALLMGKGKVAVTLKSKLFDMNNYFSLQGHLTEMKISELNPFLERNAFIYVVSGEIESMKFNFTANKYKSTGNLTILYNDLLLAAKNKQTNDTSKLNMKIVSKILNFTLYSDNPLSNKEVRVGIIDYTRNPEKSFFNYYFKSIFSGVSSSILKNPKNKIRNLKNKYNVFSSSYLQYLNIDESV